MRFTCTFVFLLTASVFQSVVGRSAGCGKTPPASGTKSIGSRQYILQTPANYDSNREYKLIFGFHPLGGSMNQIHPNYYGIRALANETAIFISPNGLDSGWANTNNRDVDFVDQILSEVLNNLCVDEKQIFSTGFSYGGAMSYALACARANVFRAVAVLAGASISGCTGGETKIAYLGIHGVQDQALSVSQGRALRDRYLRVNSCQSKDAPEPPRGSDTNYIKTEYSCDPGYPVWWMAHGGDHTWGASYMANSTWDFWTRAIYEGVGNPPTTTTSTPTLPPTSTPPPTTTVPPGGGNCAANYGQCGGQGWNGATCCQSGSACQVVNQWYSQCL